LVENTAEIYFDFNDPIVTNTVETYYLCQDTETSFSQIICEGEEYYWPLVQESFGVEGLYFESVKSSLGCDSMVTLNLHVLDENHPDCLEKILFY